jgi:ABC-2 type transport system ATP-binding protein
MTFGNSMAALEGVHKRYGDQVALDGLDLEVREGELLALLGPNGAGKTTAISILLGLKRADSGSVRLLRGSPRDISNRRGVGVILQQEHLMGDMRTRELIDLVTSYYPDPYTPDEVMEITNTAEIAHKYYRHLSGGLQRRVQFALAICGRPKLVFLDEPTAGLDIESREMLWNTIRRLLERTTAIVLTTHYLEEAEELAHRVMMIADGKCVANGTVGEVCGVVPRKSITCYATTDIEHVRSWPEVREATIDEKGRLNLVVTDADAVARRLLAADSGVRELEVRAAGLSEAFKVLTKETKQ